jgi:hypothetical protein
MRDRLSTTVKALYETDFVAWTHQTAELVRKGRLGEIDLEVLAEEIEDLGKSERSAIRSHLTRMMMHLIKQRIQPERNSASWRTSIIDARMQILAKIEDSPSLLAYAEANLERLYLEAIEHALEETGLQNHAKNLAISDRCPWKLQDLLHGSTDELAR